MLKQVPFALIAGVLLAQAAIIVFIFLKGLPAHSVGLLIWTLLSVAAVVASLLVVARNDRVSL